MTDEEFLEEMKRIEASRLQKLFTCGWCAGELYAVFPEGIEAPPVEEGRVCDACLEGP